MSRRLPIRVPSIHGLAVAKRSLGLLLTLVTSSAAGASASRLPVDPLIVYDALAKLAPSDPREELPCQVSFDKPHLGFDLRFHSEYRLTLPLKVVAYAGGWLLTAMRVTPTLESVDPVYLVRRFVVPDVLTRNRGEASLSGGFDLGPGRYRVDLLLGDARERVCAAHWYLEPKTSIGLPLTLYKPGT
jgi:hypothetical protein